MNTGLESITFLPLVSGNLFIIIVLALLLFAAVSFFTAKRRPWRFISYLAIIAFISGPQIKKMEGKPLNDIALVAYDKSISQSLAERPLQIAETESRLGESLQMLPSLDTVNIEITGDSQTALFTAISRKLKDIPAGRLAGIITVTDGRIHDADSQFFSSISRMAPGKPIHFLITGHSSEKDRLLELVAAPRFGMVGDTATAKIRISDENINSSQLATLKSCSSSDSCTEVFAEPGEEVEIPIKISHAGENVVKIETETMPGEITSANNSILVRVNGIRERMRVLIVTGKAYPGQRSWRNLLKSDPSVDLVHFNILRTPQDELFVSESEMSLIPFPIDELFGDKINKFDLIILDTDPGRNLLPENYLANMYHYVVSGGSLLHIADPSYIETEGLYYSQLQSLLPSYPDTAFTGAFIPAISDLGKVHPITEPLAENAQEWGKWFRQIKARAGDNGSVLMNGADGSPLLMVSRVGEGRVAQLLSDQIWLWARGFDGGGPNVELSRRIIHWLLKEPELEENAIRAKATSSGIELKLRGNPNEVRDLTLSEPGGDNENISVTLDESGYGEKAIESAVLGIYTIHEKEQTLYVEAGGAGLEEMRRVTSNTDVASEAVRTIGGSVQRIKDGLPDIKLVGPSSSRSGYGWIGLVKNGEFAATEEKLSPLLPYYAYFLIAAVFLILAWRSESR